MTRILLIEDYEANRDLISRYLRLFDYEVIAASDGRVGLTTAQLERSAIDLVLLDMNLPEMDGWEVARHVTLKDAVEELHLPYWRPEGLPVTAKGTPHSDA
jgi:CheY-like chemotaxis protein